MLLLIPGFLLQPNDYSVLTKQLPKARVVDIWPREAAHIKEIGSPGTQEFETWLENVARRCDRLLEHNPDTTLVCHSAGAEIARRMKRRGIPTVAIGCRRVENAFHVVGETDVLCKNDVTEETILVQGGHFNCVNKEAVERIGARYKRIGVPTLVESHVDATVEIADVIRRISDKTNA